MSRHTQDVTKREILTILEEFDLDKDGSLNEAEINRMLAVIQSTKPGESSAADILRERYDKDGDGVIGVSELGLLQSDITLSSAVTRYMMYVGTTARRMRYVRVFVGGRVPPWVFTASYGFTWCAISWDVAFETYCAVRHDYGIRDVGVLGLKRTFFDVTASLLMPGLTMQAISYGVRTATAKAASPRLQLYGPPAAVLCALPFMPLIWDPPVRRFTDSVFAQLFGVIGA